MALDFISAYDIELFSPTSVCISAHSISNPQQSFCQLKTQSELNKATLGISIYKIKDGMTVIY